MNIKIDNLRKSYGALNVLEDVTFSLEESRITSILGPSGCGKTTILNIMSGILQADSGSIIGIEGRKFSYCFQEPRLLGWLSAEDNLRFALSSLFQSSPRTNDIELRIERFLREAGLWEFRKFKPSQLSGGMQKRLALARAFAFPADMLLLDEAFSEVDLRKKMELMEDFLHLWKDEEPTVVIVTHDIHDALYLADQVIVLSQRPAIVEGTILIDIPHEKRTFTSSELYGYEKELYRLLGLDRTV
ncbi:MAG TPA: ABC transporter ATP-binding protein [Rectinema sp.]|jgi:NitT/TauT family transport system ATP-binding protein|nr:ABC transporter ATP-binding protein [Spirochaetia bacterium]MDI9426468.1 ABC transporter ATP-binding protein [Spirochaetota bacterium]NLH89591.1 ABC transporter ATP-binding protein [Treponema sp.]OQC75194.1 MAG: Bicarbonate transport ATP-binding protein CmpD [Spirochaetes bacterium ADurb.Bin001]HNP92562.1 ABC transporter ATP-binding protein [Rectinema sp.]